MANNLHVLEAGLTLWSTAAGTKPIEFPVDTAGRRIDILAKDADGVPVVIELKVSRGHERTIGQALYYRGQVKAMFEAASPRIMIVAREISSELSTAATDIPSISLHEYRLSLTVNRVR